MQVQSYVAQCPIARNKAHIFFRAPCTLVRVARRGQISAMSPPKPCSAAQSQWGGNIWMGVERGEGGKREGRKEGSHPSSPSSLSFFMSYSPFLRSLLRLAVRDTLNRATRPPSSPSVPSLSSPSGQTIVRRTTRKHWRGAQC